MTGGCTLQAQVEVLWVEGLTQRKIARFLGIAPKQVARYLGVRWANPHGPTPSTSRNAGRTDFTPLGEASRTALSVLADLGGASRRPEWRRASGLPKATFQAATITLTRRCVEVCGAPYDPARTWRLTEVGWKIARGEYDVADQTDHAALQTDLLAARANGVSDRQVALRWGVSTRLLRKLSGARGESHPRPQPDCSPCVACSKPIFARDYRGLCRDCRQHHVPLGATFMQRAQVSVPVRASLAVPIEVARRIGRDFEVPTTWQWLTLTPDSPGVNWTCHHAQLDLCPALPPPPKTCENCGVQFNTPQFPWQRYCTPTCRSKPPIETKICAECGDEFTPHWRRKDQRFCTNACRVRAARQRSYQKPAEVVVVA